MPRNRVMDGIDTPHLRLVPLSEEEAHAILHGQRPVEDRWAPDYPTDAALVAAGLVVTAAAEGRHLEPWTPYQVLRREDGLAIGGAGFGLGPPDPTGAVHVAFSIVDSVPGATDLAAEAVAAMVAFAKRQPGVTRVLAETAPTNATGIAVYEGAGMRRTGEDAHLVTFES